MKSMKLKDHKYSQCKVQVNQEDGLLKLVFISYVTPVIAVFEDPGSKRKFKIWCSGTYSRTTIRQIGWFLREYFPELNYYNMKGIAGKDEFKVGYLNCSKYDELQEVLK